MPDLDGNGDDLGLWIVLLMDRSKQVMAFTIDHGSPGVLTALLILFDVAALVIVVLFLISALRGARDELADDGEPDV